MKLASVLKTLTVVALLGSASTVFAQNACPDGWTAIGLDGGCTASQLGGGSGSRKDSRNDRQFFAGFNWKFDGKNAPDLVFGYQDLKVKSDKDVYGGRFELTLTIKDGISPGSIKLSGVAGKTQTQGLLGLGYRFGQGFLVSGGAQIPYVTGGVDYVPGMGFTPYAGVNTLHKPKLPSRRAGAGGGCPEFTEPDWGGGYLWDSVPTIAGGTCSYLASPND